MVEVSVAGQSLGVCFGEPYEFAVRGAAGGRTELTVAWTTTNADLLEE